jgi:hypothetical protein
MAAKKSSKTVDTSLVKMTFGLPEDVRVLLLEESHRRKMERRSDWSLQDIVASILRAGLKSK